MLRPKLYIRAMNRIARSRGVDVRRSIVRRICRVGRRHAIDCSNGSLVARSVVDARGLYGTGGAGRCRLLGKVFLLFEGEGELEPRCFIDMLSDDVFDNVYGFVSYRRHRRSVLSKFGFTERCPVVLRNHADVEEWFEGGYHRYPYLRAALDRVAGYTRRTQTFVRMKPCAFAATPDGRPIIASNDGVITVSGCNGMAARCCQAIAEQAISALGDAAC
jgi:glycine/D-amino acid oxidase-like deaminating enzyme